VNRRDALGFLGAALVAPTAAAQPAVDTATVYGAGRSIRVSRYLAGGAGRRSAVLLLHGAKGLESRAPAYDLYARSLATAGLDAWLFSYYRPNQAIAIDQASDASEREDLYAQFIGGWIADIRLLTSHAKQQERSSGKVGLLGFSLGGMVAVAAANRSDIAALALFYAAAPRFYRPALVSLPPLLELHGDADRSVPLIQGAALVATAKRLGGVADLVVYAGQEHGFDLDPSNRDGERARRQATRFLTHWLPPG